MHSVEEAQRHILEVARPLPAVDWPLGDSLGLVLAEDIASDIDMPPCDKALMDGFAVRAADLPEGRGELLVVAEIFAGYAPWSEGRALQAGQAARIMTGAPIPPGADAVVMIERTRESRESRVESREPEAKAIENGKSKSENPSTTHHSPLTTHRLVSIDDPRLKPDQNIMRRGTEMTRGQQVLKAGTPIRPPELGLLAAVGRATVSVVPRPSVAIISTGNEIVEAHDTPGPGQIRNSNGPTLAALVARAGGEPRYLGIARDTGDDLRRLVNDGLKADILLLSGGVSAGELDLVPDVLGELGVREVFHKVNLKPGKPVWFGRVEGGGLRVEGPETRGELRGDISDLSTLNAQRSTLNPLVFGLPGNPVSVMVCFELFVRPTIRQLMGVTPAVPPTVSAVLTQSREYRSDRPTYWPAWLELTDDGLQVRLVAWKGSPDLRATTDANCFAVFPCGDHQLRPGDRIQVLSTEYGVVSGE